jgi:hypothetical protein
LTAKQLEQVTKVSLRTIQRHLRTMPHKEIVKCVAIDGYQLAISEREKIER